MLNDIDINLLFDIAQVIFLIPFLYLLNQVIFKRLKRRHSFFSFRLMNSLFFYHLIFGTIYYVYASFNPSDSHRYFQVPQKEGKEWMDFATTGTGFIDFVSYPFINYLGFSYEMMMLLFTWIGYLGFVYAYLIFRENMPHKIKVFKKINLLPLLLFLPNMHFWTASLGKGAPIFLGLMVFAYAVKNSGQRWQGLFFGSLLIFCIRPHIFLLVAVVAILGILLSNKHIEWKKKLVYTGLITAVLLIFRDQILGVVNLGNSQDLISDFIAFTDKRADSLGQATSGVAMSEYSLFEKFFTFWFRPLFFDAPGFFGIIVSAENFIYLLLAVKLFKRNFFNFIKIAPVKVKMSLLLFLLGSFAMTFVMSNLGIIIRQKTMVMYFLFFVIYYFLAHEQMLKSTPKVRTLQIYPRKAA
ncbi:MAG: hypothetical protein RI572_00815 [Salegentibacter sp.]|uniref:hypothetical protein n=1 Tax=Salegentibacter sp. TaxID=1903072 RepID=UPI00286FBB6F|nr:hypothetical protein [Salegentibacter sp.]MDR9455923.1 hypothetical protein [Salegentibacter sp.]